MKDGSISARAEELAFLEVAVDLAGVYLRVRFDERERGNVAMVRTEAPAQSESRRQQLLPSPTAGRASSRLYEYVRALKLLKLILTRSAHHHTDAARIIAAMRPDT